MLIRIDNQLIKEVNIEADQSPRKRKNYNFHDTAEDPLQRMIHVMNPGTYVQPHKHEDPDKREAFIILEGRVAVLEFDDEGKVKDKVVLDPDTRSYGAEIAPRSWHSLVALKTHSVVYEIKDGPYSPIDDKNFAAWAPREDDASCASYLKQLIAEQNLS